MKRILALVSAAAAAVLAVAGPFAAEEARPRLTIYNQGFALLSETRSLALEEGVNEVSLTGVTALLEPGSVVLRDPRDPEGIRVLDQAYRAEPLSQEDLLRRHEGRTLQFQRLNPATGALEARAGKLIRSGQAPGAAGQAATYAPIVEVDGKIQFSLPGEPVFDRLPPDTALKPMLLWHLWVARAGKRDLDLSYSTGGLTWQATYNVLLPEKGDRIDLVGWVSLENRSGTSFMDAAVRLMAGDVRRVEMDYGRIRVEAMAVAAPEAPGPQVTERAFDEYHLYTLNRPVTLADGQTTQAEFCRAGGVPATRFNVYDGAQVGGYFGYVQNDPAYGTRSVAGVRATLEFANAKDSGLGLPLPAGTMRVYRADPDGQRALVGESRIGHTPADETIRIELGNAFDLVGERKQTDFRVDQARETAEEAFEIRLRNRRKEAVEIRVMERLYRWATWRILASSDPYDRKDARTIEFRVKVPPGGEKVITYQVRYSW